MYNKAILNNREMLQVALTIEQRERLYEIVKETNYNAKKGFEKASTEFGVTVSTIRNTWYNKGLADTLRNEIKKGVRRPVYNKYFENAIKPRSDIEIDDDSHISKGTVEPIEENKAESISDISEMFNNVFNNYSKIKEKLNSIMKENEELRKRNDQLEEDYNGLMSIINKARVLYVNETITDPQIFKMEKTGNLNRLDSSKGKVYL